MKHRKAKFNLALYAFAALLDPIFNFIGIFNSSIPLYASVLLVLCALRSVWIAFSNAYSLGRISPMAAFWQFSSWQFYRIVLQFSLAIPLK